jgi:hypothetical protein
MAEGELQLANAPVDELQTTAMRIGAGDPRMSLPP